MCCVPDKQADVRICETGNKLIPKPPQSGEPWSIGNKKKMVARYNQIKPPNAKPFARVCFNMQCQPVSLFSAKNPGMLEGKQNVIYISRFRVGGRATFIVIGSGVLRPNDDGFCTVCLFGLLQELQLQAKVWQSIVK